MNEDERLEEQTKGELSEHEEKLAHNDDLYDDYVNEYFLKTTNQLAKRIERLKKALLKIKHISENTKLAPSLRCDVITYEIKSAMVEDYERERKERIKR